MIKLQLPWKNCAGFSLDNTSANLGIRNSIKSRVKNNNCYFMGCPCHIIHNTAHKGSAGFTCNTKFDVEDFRIDIFYYFDKSTKRKNALQGYAKFCDQEYRDILKHINVRWLSLERAIERILLQYSSLSAYFLSENAPKSATDSNGVESEWGGAKRFKRLENAFKDPMTEAYLYFFSGVLPAFKQTNLLLQREDPCTQLVHSQLNRFLLQLAGKFMSVTEIKSAPQVSDINIDNHKPQEELFIGICTKNLLNKLFEDGEISALDKQKFFAEVLAFYSEVFSFGVEKLPTNDSVLKHSFFADVSKRESLSIDDVLFFVEKFHLNFNPETINLLSEQFLDYQLLNDHDIPDSVWQNACTMDDDRNKYYRVDILWGYISQMKDCIGKHRFDILFKVVKLVLVLPHSNASEERVFSIVRKNKTKFRASMGFSTLGSILTVKLANSIATKFKSDKALLKSAKSATWE